MRTSGHWATMAAALALITGCLTVRVPAHGTPQESGEKKHAIDLWFDKEMEKPENQSTQGMRHVVWKASEKWDAEMNRVYKKLMAHLDSKQKAALQKSQRAWIAFRDAEIQTTIQITGRMDGTMWQVVGDQQRTNLVRDRANQLIEYDRLGKE